MTRRPTAVVVLEQHLGHKTYADNLKTSCELAALDITWVDVTYHARHTQWAARAGLAGVVGTVTGMAQVRSALRADVDIQVFNTQVPAALAGSKLRQPYVVITDVTPIQYDRIASGYGHRSDRFAPIRTLKHRRNLSVFRNAQRCVAWSSWAAESIVDDYGVDRDRVVVIPPGVDTERWRPRVEQPAASGNPVRILFVGGEFERKGGDLLLAAVEDLGSRVHTTIVTRSPVESSPNRTVHRGLAPNDPDLIALYRAADIFVLPTRAETFGIAAIEAQSAGLPVISSMLGGLVDIVEDGVTGRLVDRDQPRQLREAIMQLVDDPVVRADYSSAARDRAVRLFDARHNAQRLFRVIRDCCD